MNKIREILLTEYIGAILVALLISEAIIVLVTLLVGQIYYRLLAGVHNPGTIPMEPLRYSILTTLVRMLMYLASAYMLVRWLYGEKPVVTRQSTETIQTNREV